MARISQIAARDDPVVPEVDASTARSASGNGRIRWLDYLGLPLLLLIWQLVAMALASRFLPSPVEVATAIVNLSVDGKLVADFAKTLARAAAGFAVSMVLGIALGLALGRVRSLDRLFNTWVIVGLNLPAIVIAIICYVWMGLTEVALVTAVIINKVPLVVTTIREGVRSFMPEYDELADAFRMPFGRRMRLIYVPQLMPFILAAARTGLSLIWKIVLVFELLGSDGGVGFRIGVYFQFFDIKSILAYTVAFIALVMLVEFAGMRPLERWILRWRTDRS